MTRIRDLGHVTADVLHRESLKAGLLEDLGKRAEAIDARTKAAEIAGILQDPRQQVYHETLCLISAGIYQRMFRVNGDIADKADKFLAAISFASIANFGLQRAFDAATKYYEENRLVEYLVQAYCALADRCAESSTAKSLNAAAQASVFSMVIAAGTGL